MADMEKRLYRSNMEYRSVDIHFQNWMDIEQYEKIFAQKFVYSSIISKMCRYLEWKNEN